MDISLLVIIINTMISSILLVRQWYSILIILQLTNILMSLQNTSDYTFNRFTLFHLPTNLLFSLLSIILFNNSTMSYIYLFSISRIIYIRRLIYNYSLFRPCQFSFYIVCSIRMYISSLTKYILLMTTISSKYPTINTIRWTN